MSLPTSNVIIPYGAPAAGQSGTTSKSSATVKADLNLVAVDASGKQSFGPYAWLLATVVLLSFFYLINKSRIGHALIYYGLCLLLLLTLVTQYQFVHDALAPFTPGDSFDAPKQQAGPSTPKGPTT